MHKNDRLKKISSPFLSPLLLLFFLGDFQFGGPVRHPMRQKIPWRGAKQLWIGFSFHFSAFIYILKSIELKGIFRIFQIQHIYSEKLFERNQIFMGYLQPLCHCSCRKNSSTSALLHTLEQQKSRGDCPFSHFKGVIKHLTTNLEDR